MKKEELATALSNIFGLQPKTILWTIRCLRDELGITIAYDKKTNNQSLSPQEISIIIISMIIDFKTGYYKEKFIEINSMQRNEKNTKILKMMCGSETTFIESLSGIVAKLKSNIKKNHIPNTSEINKLSIIINKKDKNTFIIRWDNNEVIFFEKIFSDYIKSEIQTTKIITGEILFNIVKMLS